MPTRTSWTFTNARRAARATVLSLSVVCAACSILLDRGSTQCQSDADCGHFGAHPFCRGGVCAPSGLGPQDCAFGPPQQPGDFLNGCSTAQCLSFDNCQRLGLCDDASNLTSPLVPPPSGSTPAAAASASDAGSSPPSCADANGGRDKIMVLTGSSNFPPLLSKLAPLLVGTGFVPVFQVTNSCAGVKSMYAPSTAGTLMDPAPGSNARYAAYFQADGTQVPCSLGPQGAVVDVGESDIFASTCGVDTSAGGVGEYLGPIQSMAFVVPGQSHQTAITAEAARAVFGMGGTNASPWTDPSLYFVRNANTGTQQMIGRAIEVPANAFWGTDRGTAANVDALLRVIADPTLADRSIGIISTDYYDADRDNLRALAFKAPGQSCAYLPDSTEFKKDKQNVRDGHYPVWGPIHFFAAVVDGVPVSPAAQAFVSVVSVPNVPRPLLDAFIASSLVPTCAMGVKRDVELGPLSTFRPPFECGCYFEASPSVNGAAPAGCTPCNTANDCGDPARPACNLGYCEAQ